MQLGELNAGKLILIYKHAMLNIPITQQASIMCNDNHRVGIQDVHGTDYSEMLNYTICV